MSTKFTPVKDKPFVWVDTETTGLDETKHEIIDIAIIRVTPDGSESVFNSKIRMDFPENAEPRALEINGYTQAAWEGAPSAQEVFQSIHDRGLLANCILAGHNVSFDARFINATFKRLGFTFEVDYHLYDTVTLALAYLKTWVSSVSLEPVCVALGIPVNNHHTALADARMAMAVERALLSATEEERDQWAHVIPERLQKWKQQKQSN